MRRTVHKSRLAESDLVEIWECSFEQWDANQADKYLDELDRRIQLLADNPELGPSRDYVREGYRVLFVNRHARLRPKVGTRKSPRKSPPSAYQVKRRR